MYLVEKGKILNTEILLQSDYSHARKVVENHKMKITTNYFGHLQFQISNKKIYTNFATKSNQKFKKIQFRMVVNEPMDDQLGLIFKFF